MEPTRIAPDIEFEGVVKARDPVKIEGKISGHIDSEGLIFVDRKGRVEGSLNVAELVVAGTVQGDVRVIRQLEVVDKGELYCELEDPPERLLLSEKARLGGVKNKSKAEKELKIKNSE